MGSLSAGPRIAENGVITRCDRLNILFDTNRDTFPLLESTAMAMKEPPVTADDLRPVRQAEVARRLGVSRAYVRQLVAGGRLQLNADGLVEQAEYERLLTVEAIAWCRPGTIAAVEAHRLGRS